MYEASNTKEYVIKSAQRDANGVPVSEGRVYAADTFAKACDGILEFNEKGEVVYKVCFAPGTLVHTDQGLVPIEKIRVGTRVLSQPEQGGEREYRHVVNTVAHLDQPVHAVQVKVEGAESLCTLIATANHPFWVESPLVEDQHWLAAECLEPGLVLQLNDGRQATVHAAGLVRRTQHAHIAFAADDRAGVGIVLDISDKQIKLARDEVALDLGKLELAEPYLTPVYNFEVEGFHTYYVGEVGVWVHNSNCNGKEALDAVANKAEIEANKCFDGDTQVHTPLGVCDIEYLRVGDLVLSRCEKTGEQAYRRVVGKFEHKCEESYFVDYGTENGTKAGVYTTAEHPFWVNDVGWVPACELKQGQILEIVDPIDVTDEWRPEGKKKNQLAASGGRWQAEVVGIGVRNNVRQYAGETYLRTVFNIEVEDFHTYFVGWHGVWVHNKNPADSAKVAKPLDRATPNSALEGYIENPDNYTGGKRDDIAAQVHVFDEVAKHGFEVVGLPDSPANKLGLDPRKRPDGIIDGRVADGYAPTTDSIRNICSNIQQTTIEQARDIVLDISRIPSLTAQAIFDNINQWPIPTLGRLYVYTAEGELYVRDFGAQPVYGQWPEGPGVTTEILPQRPPSGIVKRSGNLTAPTQGLLSSNAATRVQRTDLEAACFDGETKVVVENGALEDIQYIDVGRSVLSRCEKTGETAYRKVLKHYRRYHVPTYDLYCLTDGGLNELPITATAEHPFWVKGKGWTPVAELQSGDVLENIEGTQTTVWKLKKTGYFSDVHNLEVDEFNTYFVGEHGYWVHNCNALELKIWELVQKDGNVSGVLDNLNNADKSLTPNRTELLEKLATVDKATNYGEWEKTVSTIGELDFSEALAKAGINEKKQGKNRGQTTILRSQAGRTVRCGNRGNRG